MNLQFKKLSIKSIIFLKVIFLFLVVNAKSVLAQAPSKLGSVDGNIGGYPVTGTEDLGYYLRSFEGIFSAIVGFLTILSGLFFIIHFIIGGFTWSTSGGDPQKIETAKTKMTNGAIGLIIVVAAYSIIYIISQILGLDILHVGGLIVRIGPSTTI